MHIPESSPSSVVSLAPTASMSQIGTTLNTALHTMVYRVQSSMIMDFDQFQIFKTIVGAIMIAVMDMVTFWNRTEGCCPNPAMFQPSNMINLNLAVPTRQEATESSLIRQGFHELTAAFQPPSLIMDTTEAASSDRFRATREDTIRRHRELILSGVMRRAVGAVPPHSFYYTQHLGGERWQARR